MTDQMTSGQMAKFAIAVITIAAIVLAGMAITAQYSQVLRTPTTANESDTNTVASLAAVNTSQTLTSYPFLQDLDDCVNSTNASLPITKTTDYTFKAGSASGGTMALTDTGSDWVGSAINCSTISYLADSTAQGFADSFTSGLAIFGTFIAIIVLSLVGKVIVSIFGPRKG